MKTILLSIVATFIGVIGLAGHTAYAADQYVNQADIDAVQAVLADVNAFSESISSDDVETLVSAGKKAQSSLNGLQDKAFSIKLGGEYITQSAVLKEKAKAVSDAISPLVTSIQSEDFDTANDTHLPAYNASVDAFNQSLVDLDASVEESNNSTGSGYMYLLIATVVVSIASFAWAFLGGKTFSAEKIKARRSIAYTSLAPLVGAGITYGSFLAATNGGGTYTIAYGLVIIGAIALIGAIVRYLRTPPGSTTTPLSAPTAPPPLAK